MNAYENQVDNRERQLELEVAALRAQLIRDGILNAFPKDEEAEEPIPAT